MQTFGLPRQITRGAALASRLGGAERSEAAPRRDALGRWRQARADGLTARAAANAVGVPRSTLYRWQRLADRNRLDPCSRRPHTLRRPAWSAALVAAVQEIRADYPMWGKAKIARPAAAPRARGKREHHRPHPQDPHGARRRHPGPDLAPQRAARRPAPQASRQTPAQGPQAHYTRRDPPTRHPHRLATPGPARHQAIHRP